MEIPLRRRRRKEEMMIDTLPLRRRRRKEERCKSCGGTPCVFTHPKNRHRKPTDHDVLVQALTVKVEPLDPTQPDTLPEILPDTMPPDISPDARAGTIDPA